MKTCTFSKQGNRDEETNIDRSMYTITHKIAQARELHIGTFRRGMSESVVGRLLPREAEANQLSCMMQPQCYSRSPTLILIGTTSTGHATANVLFVDHIIGWLQTDRTPLLLRLWTRLVAGIQPREGGTAPLKRNKSGRILSTSGARVSDTHLCIVQLVISFAAELEENATRGSAVCSSENDDRRTTIRGDAECDSGVSIRRLRPHFALLTEGTSLSI